MADAETAAPMSHPYVYGVAHVNDGGRGHVRPAADRAAAESDLQDCLAEAADCYLVRAPRDPWERVPDGE